MSSTSEHDGLKMREVPRIFTPPDRPLTDDNIDQIIEIPLRAAVRVFMGKGIRTYLSTADSRDPNALLYIESRYLSQANIALACQVFGYSGEENKRIEIALGITPDTPVSEVEGFFLNAASLFANQKSP